MRTAIDSGKRKYIVIMLIYLLGIFIGAIDTGILTPARTIISHSFGVDDKIGIWMITAFTLSYACSMPILGKLADRIGRKRVYIAAILLFGLGSLLCGLSNFTHSFSVLIIGRVIQAFGGGGIMPLATAEFGTSFPTEKRGMALGLVGGVYGIANILGATLGSAVLDLVGAQNWHWIFFINLPICAFVILSGVFLLPKGEKLATNKIDFAGIFVLVSLVLSLLYGLNNLNFFKLGETITDPAVYPFLVLFAALVPLFLYVEKKAKDPVFNINYFKNRNIVITFFLSLIAGVCLMGMVFIPQFAENSLKIASGKGGYFVTILGLFAGIGAPLSGVLIDKFGSKKILMFGFSVIIIAALFVSLVAINHISLWSVIVSLILIGTGLGFVMGTPLNYMMLENTSKNQSNSALSALSLMRSIGTTIGPVLMIGFIAQAGMTAQSSLMNLLPPISSIQIQADAAVVEPLKRDLLSVKSNISKMAELKKILGQKVDQLEQSNAQLSEATAKREKDFSALESDPQFKEMLDKMDIAQTRQSETPDFSSIRSMLDSAGDLDTSRIDESLDMLDFKNQGSMNFDMNSGDGLPKELALRMQNSDVTNIVTNTVYLVDFMFGEKVPSVVGAVQKGIGEGIVGVQSGIDGMQKAKAGIAEGVAGLRSGIDGITKGIAGAKTGVDGMKSGLGEMQDAVTGLQKGIAGIKSGIVGIKKGRDGIAEGIVGMQAGIAQFDVKISAAEKKLSELQQSGATADQIGSMAGQLKGLKGAREQLKAKMEGATEQKNAMDASIRKMSKNISGMNEAIARIQAAKPKLRVVISDVETEAEQMRTLQSGMSDSVLLMEDLQNSLGESSLLMSDAKELMEQLNIQIPSYFDKAKESYIEVVRQEGGKIEDVFQKTINLGFRDMYYAVAVLCAAAFTVLFLYKRKIVTINEAAASAIQE